MTQERTINELKTIKLRYDLERFATSRWDITVAINLTCNLRCIYCYELKHPVVMSSDVGKKLLLFLGANAKKGTMVTVTWFGGEPLISKDLVIELSTAARELLTALGCSYGASIITNATLLTPSIAKQLLQSGITHAQVTLDGCKHDHDNRRIGPKHQPTYEKILEALTYFPPEMKLHLRINVDSTNLHGIPAMLNDIATKHIQCDLRIYFAKLDDCGEGCRGFGQDHKHELISENALLNYIAAFLPVACDLGLTIQLPTTETGVCGAVSRQAVVVEPDGTLKKCWKDVGSSQGRVGHLDDPLSVDDPEQLSWLTYDPLSLEGCPQCELFDTCMGGCAWMVRNNVSHTMRCHPFKGGIEQIKDAVRELVDNGRADFIDGHVRPRLQTHNQ